MHIGIMEPTKRSLDGLYGQKIEESQASAEIAGRQSNYMTNMILPEMVKSSKNFPLGPDCIITRDESPEQSILLKMDLYWLISNEKGCVECRVTVRKSASEKQAVTQDPRVIITRKPRRFEAYCCALCRQNFVTIVQALLHMKAFHRKEKKILIQDQNVFHDIEKAMEVPPVPLPWYVSKRAADPLSTTTVPITAVSSDNQSTFTPGPMVDHATSSGQDISPVALLLRAVVKEYNKSVKMVFFGEDVKNVTIKFEDQTSLTAHFPDSTNQESYEVDSTETLEFKIQRLKSESDDQEACMVEANNPQLARRLLQTAIKRGVSQSSVLAIADQTSDNKVSQSEQPEQNDRSGDSQSNQIKLDSRGRPSKTVRFMIGSPDSDEDGSSSASDRVGRESSSPLVLQSGSPAPSDNVATTTAMPSSDDNNAKDDEGLKGVINQLISTASKGVISPVSPTPSSVTTSGIQEAVITNAAYHARFMPKNLSVPNLPSISIAGSNGSKSSVSTSSTTASTGLIRVQSWGGSNPASKMSLSGYVPHVPLNVAREDLRRSFAAGRSFTYAEKIKLMNKLNDEDALITQEHVKGAGKLMGAESSKSHIPMVTSLPFIQHSAALEKPLSPTVISSTGKMKKSESDLGYKLFPASDVRRKRRSKYDLDQFGNLGSSSHSYHANANVRSGSEGSVSDKDELDDTPPTLLGLLRNRPGLLQSQSLSSIATPVISDSDYYGSGEWANAAMQTLKSLQSTVNATKVTAKLGEPKQWSSIAEASALSGMKPPTSIPSTSSTTSSFVPVAGHGPAGSAIETMVSFAQQATSDKTSLPHFIPDTSSQSQTKRPHSPFSDDEKDANGASPSGTSIEERQLKRRRKVKPGTSRSSISDSNMSKPIISSPVQHPHVIAEKGDGLVFTERVTDSSLNDSNKLILKFSQSANSVSSDNPEHDMDMPSIFANSVDTFMKVRYIEKIAKCRVCGFSSPIDTTSNMEVLKSHVMEHSLKELIQAGYGAKRPL